MPEDKKQSSLIFERDTKVLLINLKQAEIDLKKCEIERLKFEVINCNDFIKHRAEHYQ